MNAQLSSSNVVAFSRPGSHDQPPPCGRQRQQRRYDTRERLKALVVLNGTRSGVLGGTFSCLVENVSASGIHFVCDESLPVNGTVDLWIDISSHTRNFFLSGTVRFAIKQHDGRFGIGVHLHDHPATDIAEWRALMLP